MPRHSGRAGDTDEDRASGVLGVRQLRERHFLCDFPRGAAQLPGAQAQQVPPGRSFRCRREQEAEVGKERFAEPGAVTRRRV